MASNPYTQLHRRLLQHYGPQQWWPADGPFEVMVGAVLTQNTAWGNVEKAIANLQAAGALAPEAILSLPEEALAALIRPSGYFNIKARRLRNLCQWYQQHGALAGLQQWETTSLRQALLGVNGVGPETADDILLYAFARPVFVIDSYTRRILSRLGVIQGDEGYESLRQQLEAAFEGDSQAVSIFNELHALIVMHAKEHCRKRPYCEGCPLRSDCVYGDQ